MILPRIVFANFLDRSTRAPFAVVERSTEPTTAFTNDVYLDDGTNTISGLPAFRRYNGSSWEDIGFDGLSTKEKVTIVSAATYTILTTDKIIAVDHTATAAVTLTLPAASTVWDSTNSASLSFLIKDSGVNACTNNITISRAGSDTIIDIESGQTSTVIDVDGGALWFQAISAAKWIVY